MKKDKKRTVEDYLHIDSLTMARSNRLIDGAAGTWVWKNREGQIISSVGYAYMNSILTLQYSINDQPTEQYIRATTTNCTYGKFRYWFLCPNSGCNKRVAKLYLVDSEFHCRHCHKLNYQIQQCPKRYVAKLNMQRMRIKLGWPLEGEIPFLKKIHKPLNKNKKTFRTMVEKHDAHEQEANAAAIAMHNAFMDKLDGIAEKFK